MLKEEYGIEPAGMLGHSAGEIPCGYADGCLTREQTILIAYHRGTSAEPCMLRLVHQAIWNHDTISRLVGFVLSVDDVEGGFSQY